MEPELIGRFDPEWLLPWWTKTSQRRLSWVTKLSRICDVVRTEFGLPANFAFHVKNRTAHFAAARQVAMYLVRALCGWPFPRIGRSFKRDHTTVIHSCNVVARRMRQNPQFARLVERLMAECR